MRTTVAALIEALDLKNVVHVGHSTGGGEVARYIGHKASGQSRPDQCGAPADAKDRRQSRRLTDRSVR
jgi:pimeloyl-ACP methyl ester carboxylesterase